MHNGVVKRVEYRDPVTGTVRTGATGHGESLTDMETYQLPIDWAREAALHSWGVAEGLAVHATVGQTGVTVSPGTALDADGRLIVLPVGGTAVVDPNLAPDQIQDVPTVLVGDDGITLNTTGAPTDCLLTITWREVLGDSDKSLLHAPWLRLVAATSFPDNGRQVVLARVVLDSTGKVNSLSAGPRRLVGTSAGRLELRAPRTSDEAGVAQGAMAELTADASGDVALTFLSGDAPRAALTIARATGEVRVSELRSRLLSVSGALRLSPPEGRGYEMSSGTDGSWRLRDVTAGVDRVVVATSGNVGIGTGATEAGLSVSAALRLSPPGGRGYEMSSGSDGSWRLRDVTAGADRVVVNASGNPGLDISRRVRVRQSGEGSAGVWFWQDGPKADRAFVGMADDTHVGFWGNTGAGWGMRMDTTTGEVQFSGGQVRATKLSVSGALQLSSPTGQGYEISSGADGSWRLRDVTAGADRVVVNASGNPGLDISRRVRVRQSGEGSAGVWFWQDGPKADRAFVGMADDTHVGFWGNTGAGWGMRMDTTTGEVLLSGRRGGPSTLSLWGSQIGDTGGGILFIRSGGPTVTFDGADNVGINTRTPQAALDVVGSVTAIRASGGSGRDQAGVSATGDVGVMADGTTTGILGSSHNWAGFFWGNVRVTRNLEVAGTLTKGGGGFKIDHPLDGGGKYLSHSFVESPEMLTVYAGTAVTDDKGEATVSLPGYFEALNRDHRFQLTTIGQPAMAWVHQTVRDNAFTIRTDQPGVEVSWQITGVRQDPWAEANRIRVEEDKPEAEQDKYLHPEVYEQPEHARVMGTRPEPK